MKKSWKDPVKDHPAKESTLNTPGDFKAFKDLMKKVVEKKPKSSSSPAPAAS